MHANLFTPIPKQNSDFLNPFVARTLNSIGIQTRHAKVHAKHVQDGQDQFKREEKNDPGYRSRRVKAQQLRARRQELERARKVAIPFEKSQKRRAEMRATSEDCTGLRKNHLLYMKAKDGSVIYRVTKQGDLSARNIVGPVVDPVPPDDFESESD